MVFDSTNKVGRKVILTELESNGNNFVVVLSAELKGNKLEVNRVRSLYPKDNVQGIIDWINAGNLLKYADKNKALEWIGKQQSNSAEVTNTIKNLDVSAKLLQNFENPPIIEEKNAEKIKDLPNAINNPMMVYEWGTKAKSTIIITNITRESGDKITVAVKLERNGEEMTINEIASIHGKEGQRFISDMINAKEGGIEKALKYIQKDRKEVLDWLGLDAPKASASLTNEELHIAKVLQTFKNPAIIEQKNEKKRKR